MIIQRWRLAGAPRNFGDELNEYLWPRLLDPKFNEAPGDFYGIGTILRDPLPPASQHTIFGAGTGYRGVPTPDSTWNSYFVRGPLTSAALGGIPYITDPAILVRHFHNTSCPTTQFAFMPRWDNYSPELVASCAKVGIPVINPSLPCVDVISTIQSTALLLTEALHGAVVADSLRVPWVSIYADRGHEFKWRDWCGSLDIVWSPIDMEQFTLKWAIDHAVPQLSAQSICDARYFTVLDQLAKFNQRLMEYTT